MTKKDGGYPANQTVVPGSDVILNVTAAGNLPLSYAWSLNGIAISDATNSTLTVTNISPIQTGHYAVSITDGVGATKTVSADVSFLSLNVFPVLTIVGNVGNVYRIDYSEDLNTNTWSALTNIVIGISPYFFVDTQAPLLPKRFYRAVFQP